MSEITERIARMIESDGNGAVHRTLRVAQSDVMALLCEFMDVTKLDMYADKTENGYTVNVRAEVARFYEVGKTTESE